MQPTLFKFRPTSSLSTPTHTHPRYLTEKAHVWFLSCPDAARGAVHPARPHLHRKHVHHETKLIGLLRTKRRELVRGANSFLQTRGFGNTTFRAE